MKGESLTLSAARMGSNFTHDPELNLPEYPRLPPEIMTLPYGHTGLLFVGARGTQLLSGRAARFLITKLLQHLDGTKRIEAICERFPNVPAKSIRDAVALMYSRGLLEDGRPARTDETFPDLAAFAGRFADVTRVNRNRSEALDRLAGATVAIGGSPTGTRYLAEAFIEQGLGGVEVVADPAALDAAPTLLVAIFTGEGAEAADWLQAAHARGVRTLHAHIGEDAVEVGPLFVPGSSGCYECLRELRAAPAGTEPTDAGFWAGIVALQAFHLVSRIGVPALYNLCHVHHRTPHGRIYEERKIARLPGCRSCGLDGRWPAADSPERRTWLLHSLANGMPPRELLTPRDYQQHFAAANVQITQQAPAPYYGATAVALPEGLAMDAVPSWLNDAEAVAEPDLEALARLLRFAVGCQPMGDGQRRIAPTGGGLGSAEMCVVARSVEGLGDGVYHYDAASHRLERLREVRDEPLLGALGITAAEQPRLLLVGTGNLTKLRQKYGNFAYRFATLDGGIARGYLHELLSGLGLPYREFPDARDKGLADALSLPTAGYRNVVSYALGIGGPVRRAGEQELSMNTYVDALVERTAKLGNQARDAADPPALPPLQAVAERELREIMLARRSVRSFASVPIPTPVLKAITALTADGDSARLRTGGLSLRFKLWAAVNVGDAACSPGIYRWDPAAARFETVRTGLVPEDLEPAMLQNSLARAPAVFFVTGDFEHAVHAYGPRGYRELVSRAGTMTARALIAAGAYGVSGCPWGGLCEDAWGSLFGIDRYRDCPLFGLSLGYTNE